jgi:hypothetical protein
MEHGSDEDDPPEEVMEAVPMIVVKYSCNACGLHRVSLEVPARQLEDVLVWTMQIMALAISKDHSKRSPRCISRTMSEVMIPCSKDDGKIGVLSLN